MIKMNRTTIQIETEEIKIIRFKSGPPTADCDRCMGRVPTMTPEQAAETLNISLAGLTGLIDSSGVHLVNGGRVCARSLNQQTTNNNGQLEAI